MEFGFESLHQRRLHGKVFCLFKIINNQSPTYLFQLVPLQTRDMLYKTQLF